MLHRHPSTSPDLYVSLGNGHVNNIHSDPTQFALENMFFRTRCTFIWAKRIVKTTSTQAVFVHEDISLL